MHRPSQPSRAQVSLNWRIPDSGLSSHRRGTSGTDETADQPKERDDTNTKCDAGTRLYVGNLLYSVQRDAVETLFTSNGFEICSLDMSIDPFSGRNPSYAFVNLKSPEEATRAMVTLNGVEVFGRPVKINAGAKKKEWNGRVDGRVRNWDRAWGKQPVLDTSEGYTPTFDRWARDDASSHFLAPQDEGRRLFVGSLPRIEPQAAVDAEVQQLFAEFKPTAVSKIINPLRERPEDAQFKGNHYFVFVDFGTVQEAERAAAMVDQRRGSWGGLVRVKVSKATRDFKSVRGRAGTQLYLFNIGERH